MNDVRMASDVTRENIIEDLQRVAEIVGRGPSKKEYEEHGEHSYYHLNKLFDGLNEARAQAGLSNSDTQRAKPVPREELIKAFHDLRNELGRVPKREEMVSEGRYSEDPYRREFGSWSEAVREMGYDPHRPGKYVAEYAKKECAYCGEQFSRLASSFAENSEDYFCSPECQDQHHEEYDGGENHPLYDREIVECSQCGDELARKPSVVEKKDDFFCGQECYASWCTDERTGEDHPRWKGGGELYRGPNWERQKRKALERDNRICQRCGRTNTESKQETGKSLAVHHRKPVREFYEELETDWKELGDPSTAEIDWGEMNDLDNLVTLCLSCHRHVEKLPVRPQFG